MFSWVSQASSHGNSSLVNQVTDVYIMLHEFDTHQCCLLKGSVYLIGHKIIMVYGTFTTLTRRMPLVRDQGIWHHNITKANVGKSTVWNELRCYLLTAELTSQTEFQLNGSTIMFGLIQRLFFVVKYVVMAYKSIMKLSMGSPFLFLSIESHSFEELKISSASSPVQ